MSEAAANTETTPTEAQETQDTYFPATDNWAEPPAPEPTPAVDAPEPTQGDEQKGGDPTSTVSEETGATDPDKEWLSQADTVLETIGGRQYLNDSIDYVARLFGVTSEGPTFLEKLEKSAPGVYQQIEQQIVSRLTENLSPEMEAAVLGKLGLNAENLESYRSVEKFGLDPELIMSDTTTREFLEKCTDEERQTFNGMAKDVKAELLSLYEANKPTMVERFLRDEKREQDALKAASTAEADKGRAEQEALGQQVNEKINTEVEGMVQGYATNLKIPATYAQGIMAKAIVAMNASPEGSPTAQHWNALIAARKAGNQFLEQQSLKALKTLADQAFRNELKKEQEQTGEYNFQGFFKPAPKAAAAPAQMQQQQIQQPGQRPAPKPEDVFTSNWVEPELDMNKVLSL